MNALIKGLVQLGILQVAPEEEDAGRCLAAECNLLRAISPASPANPTEKRLKAQIGTLIRKVHEESAKTFIVPLLLRAKKAATEIEPFLKASSSDHQTPAWFIAGMKDIDGALRAARAGAWTSEQWLDFFV